MQGPGAGHEQEDYFRTYVSERVFLAVARAAAASSFSQRSKTNKKLSLLSYRGVQTQYCVPGANSAGLLNG